MLGVVLIVIDIITKSYPMLIPAFLTFAGGASCGIIAGVFKKREIAIIIPTVFCAVMLRYTRLPARAAVRR
jgi:hypothetical protein